MLKKTLRALVAAAVLAAAAPNVVFHKDGITISVAVEASKAEAQVGVLPGVPGLPGGGGSSGGGGGGHGGGGAGAALAGYAIASSACMTFTTAIHAGQVGAAKQRQLTPVEANKDGRGCMVLGSFAWIGYEDRPDNFMVAGEAWQFYEKDPIGMQLPWMCRDGSCNDGRRNFADRHWDVYHNVPINDSRQFFNGVRAKVGGTFPGLTKKQAEKYRKSG